jgi:hypothetical protein
MKYTIKTFSGWWKGFNQSGLPMSGIGKKDAKAFNSRQEALQEMRRIPSIVGFDKIVPIIDKDKQ